MFGFEGLEITYWKFKKDYQEILSLQFYYLR